MEHDTSLSGFIGSFTGMLGTHRRRKRPPDPCLTAVVGWWHSVLAAKESRYG